MERYGSVIKLKTEKFNEYKDYHKNTWPEVLAVIQKCNIANYSIFHKDGYLFSYFEYWGSDFNADMKKLSEDPKAQEWQNIMNTIQVPLETHREGEWWADMEEVFHVD